MNKVNTQYRKQEAVNQFLNNIASNKGNVIQEKSGTEKEDSNADVVKSQGVKEDSVSISQESKILLEEMRRMQEENKNSADMAEKQSKCMLIAMRIAAGDEVPQEDIKFLIKYNMGLYAKAMEMRVPKSEPEEYDSVLSEEESREIKKADMGMAPDLSDPLGIIED